MKKAGWKPRPRWICGQHDLVSGPQEEPYFNEAKDKNQLRYEAYLRSVIAEHKPVGETGEILCGCKECESRMEVLL